MPIHQARMIVLLKEAEEWKNYALRLREQHPEEHFSAVPSDYAIMHERWHINRTFVRNVKEKKRMQQKKQQERGWERVASVQPPGPCLADCELDSSAFSPEELEEMGMAEDEGKI